LSGGAVSDTEDCDDECKDVLTPLARDRVSRKLKLADPFRVSSRTSDNPQDAAPDDRKPNQEMRRLWQNSIVTLSELRAELSFLEEEQLQAIFDKLEKVDNDQLASNLVQSGPEREVPRSGHEVEQQCPTLPIPGYAKQEEACKAEPNGESLTEVAATTVHQQSDPGQPDYNPYAFAAAHGMVPVPPFMMQQSMQMAQQFGMGGMGGMGAGNAAETQSTPPAAAPANPFVMMQQMMQQGGAAPQTGTNANPMAAMQAMSMMPASMWNPFLGMYPSWYPDTATPASPPNNTPNAAKSKTLSNRQANSLITLAAEAQGLLPQRQKEKEMVRFCPNCGDKLQKTFKFCQCCGSDVTGIDWCK